MATQEQQIEKLTEKLNALENESRRILNALQWATKVRLILFCGLLLFVLISSAAFLWLYNDVKTARVAKVQQLISERPAEFSEPLTRQILQLAEEQGPYVIDVFRKQAQADSQLYMAAFDTERDAMVANLQSSIEEKLSSSYVKLLDDQEQLLVKEFPELEKPANREVVRGNMEKIYQKIGKRYYTNFLKEEIDEMAEQLETFPLAQPRQDNIPIPEQIATEFLELVRLMLIHSENYQVPETAEGSAAIIRTSKPLPSPDVDSETPPSTGDDDADDSNDDSKGSEDDTENADDGDDDN